LKINITSISIIGLGYVGLPSAVVLADNGFKVFGVDINKNLVNNLKNGSFESDEPELENLIKKSLKSARFTISTEIVSTDAYLICVPTPCTDAKKADLSFLFKAIDSISSKIKNNCLIIIESTIPIGTTEICKKKLLNSRKDLDPKKIFFSHCPERVLPGNAIYEIINNDRIIGGIDEDSILYSDYIYKRFSKGNIFHTSSKVAEMVKLSENTYRDVNIALANQLGLIAEEAQINLNEVVSLANKHPRVNIHKSGIGVGGHCIPIDPYFLLSNYKFDKNLIMKARELNIFIESITLSKIINFIESNICDHIQNIYLYGLSYKPNINDFRESPSLRIIDKLINNIKDRCIHAIDPFLEKEYEKSNIKFKKSIDNLNNSILIILVRHKSIEEIIEKKDEFKNLKLLDLS